MKKNDYRRRSSMFLYQFLIIYKITKKLHKSYALFDCIGEIFIWHLPLSYGPLP